MTEDIKGNPIIHQLLCEECGSDRTCGCRLLQNHGLSFAQVRDWLGHLNVQQTERAYAFLTVENLKEAISK